MPSKETFERYVGKVEVYLSLALNHLDSKEFENVVKYSKEAAIFCIKAVIAKRNYKPSVGSLSNKTTFKYVVSTILSSDLMNLCFQLIFADTVCELGYEISEEFATKMYYSAVSLYQMLDLKIDDDMSVAGKMNLFDK